MYCYKHFKILYNANRKVAMYSKKDPESIKNMFDNIADKYDFVNNIITFGVHNKIKKDAINMLPNKTYSRIIDLCTGTGDIAFALADKFPDSYILGMDFSSKMIEIAKNKMRKKNNKDGKYNIMIEKADVMALPYDHNIFDLATIFFGLRNVPDINKALEGIYGILKPDAELLIVDIVRNNKEDVMNDYFNKYLPKIGALFSRDKEAYKYLVESRNAYPTHSGLMKILHDHKFRIIKRKEYLNGIISLNLAKKYI